MPKATKKQLLSRILLVLVIVSLMFPLTGCKKIIKVIRHKGPPAQEEVSQEVSEEQEFITQEEEPKDEKKEPVSLLEPGFLAVHSHVTRTLSVDNEYAVHNEIFDLAKSGGMGFVRMGFRWSYIEPQKGVWDWEITDEVVRDAKNKGVRLLALVHRPPEWTNAETATLEEWLDEWLVFLGKVVDRYGDYITHWEIWNEPNLPSGNFWRQDMLPDEYAELVIKSAKLIKKKRPESTILLGGFSTGRRDDPFELWEELFQLDVLKYVDGVAFHPYPYQAHTLFSFDNQLKNLISQYSNSKEELWITEFGRASHVSPARPDASYETQTNTLLATALAFWADGGKHFFIFEFKDRGSYRANFLFAYYGIVDSNLQPKPAFNALEWLAGKLKDLTYVSHQEFNNGALIKAVDSGGKNVYFSWGETAANELKGQGLSIQIYNEQVSESNLANYYKRVLFWE